MPMLVGSWILAPSPSIKSRPVNHFYRGIRNQEFPGSPLKCWQQKTKSLQLMLEWVNGCLYITPVFFTVCTINSIYLYCGLQHHNAKYTTTCPKCNRSWTSFALIFSASRHASFTFWRSNWTSSKIKVTNSASKANYQHPATTIMVII